MKKREENNQKVEEKDQWKKEKRRLLKIKNLFIKSKRKKLNQVLNSFLLTIHNLFQKNTNPYFLANKAWLNKSKKIPIKSKNKTYWNKIEQVNQRKNQNKKKNLRKK